MLRPKQHRTARNRRGIGGRRCSGFQSDGYRRARIELSLDGVIWQRNYFDHIIRNDREFSQAFVYIDRNPEEWEIDAYNADRRR